MVLALTNTMTTIDPVGTKIANFNMYSANESTLLSEITS